MEESWLNWLREGINMDNVHKSDKDDEMFKHN